MVGGFFMANEEQEKDQDFSIEFEAHDLNNATVRLYKHRILCYFSWN